MGCAGFLPFATLNLHFRFGANSDRRVNGQPQGQSDLERQKASDRPHVTSAVSRLRSLGPQADRETAPLIQINALVFKAI